MLKTHLPSHKQSISKIGPSRRESSGTPTDIGCSNSQLAGCCYNEQKECSLGGSTAGGKHGRSSSVNVECTSLLTLDYFKQVAVAIFP